METFTTELHSHTDYRRVPKSEMEKRRRDRINNSLETLRRLLIENTCNEKLNNPKVEKAEILESVVDFLKYEVESYSAKRKRSTDVMRDGPCKRPRPYTEGMRSCLLRVGEFISTKSQPTENDESPTVSSGEESPRPLPSVRYTATSAQHLSTSAQLCATPHLTTPVANITLSTLLATRQHAYPEHLDHTEVRDAQYFSSELRCMTVDPVWRPWPQ